ncbi:MAG: hypothetical protein ACRCZB_07300 [Bacteroidales bacterium]
MKRVFYSLCFAALLLFVACERTKESLPIAVIIEETASERVKFGVEYLLDALNKQGYRAALVSKNANTTGQYVITIGLYKDDVVQLHASQSCIIFEKQPKQEGFVVKSKNASMIITGADPSGVLYGCVEVASIVKTSGKIPKFLNFVDQPQTQQRGACLNLQRPYYLSDKMSDNTPYTPKTFPWFYDKQMCVDYLNLLVSNKINTLFLWSKHPFSSLVKLKDYPYALEISDEDFEKNVEFFEFLLKEADRRGILVVQKFHNIVVPKSFAQRHRLSVQDLGHTILPVVADYTRKSITAFIEKYPNVGLLVSFDEGMHQKNNEEWLVKTIIPGVKEGLRVLDIKEEPPIIISSYDASAKSIIEAAISMYKNLHMMIQYNGEEFADYQSTVTQEKASKFSSAYIKKLQVLAKFEAFYLGTPKFIRQSVITINEAQKINGLHLYPKSFYWSHTSDSVSPYLRKINKDCILHKAWGRYAWNSTHNLRVDNRYWSNEFANIYGCKPSCGRRILDTYNAIGEIAPKLLLRFGVIGLNQQEAFIPTFIPQFINEPKSQNKSDKLKTLNEKTLFDWVAHESKNQIYIGQTPIDVIDDVLQHAKSSVEAINKMERHITKSKDKFEALCNDVYCYNDFANFFAQKTKAAEMILRYQHSCNTEDLESALLFLKNSLIHWRSLVERMQGSYLFANSMQTKQRIISIIGGQIEGQTWEEISSYYEMELANLKRNIALIKTELYSSNEAFTSVKVTLADKSISTFPLIEGERIFADKPFMIKKIAKELQNITALRLHSDKQTHSPSLVTFTCYAPVKVLVGYFNDDNNDYLQPTLPQQHFERSNDKLADLCLVNGIEIENMPSVNIYTCLFEEGRHTLELNKGRVLILGFIDAETKITPYNANFGNSQRKSMDWLFY